ncbi:MAG: 3-hydroxybenzoate 6-monooxygenase [Alcaligenaceae bacterium]|nr:3-hydroxybenzoate 6-monooxygenase [Alcaligenaceae bacterium]
MNNNKQKVIVAGGGIGGLAAALALAELGLDIDLIERAPEFREIGAGIQLGPNAFAALDALGAGESARGRAVYTDHIIMKDAVDAKTLVKFDTGERFRERFGNPYGVIHRADIHGSLLENLENKTNVSFHPSTEIVDYEETADGVKVMTSDKREFSGDILIGADGVRSVVRQKLIGDPARVTGHVVYRAVVPQERMPEELRVNAPFLWAGPHCHLVHYPLRGGKEYNLVVTFHSREQEEWGVREGSREEVLSYFQGIHEVPAQLLDLPTSWMRWATADREPIEKWGSDRVQILGDAAHPMMQYMAQGACMALEDAVTLAEAVRDKNFNFKEAFALYESLRIPRTARVVWSTREMGRIYHAKGIERQVRNSLWPHRKQEEFYDAVSWLYSWDLNNSLKQPQEWQLK